MTLFKNLKIDKEIRDSFSIVNLNGEVYSANSIYRATYNRIFLIEKGNGFIGIDDLIYPVSGNELFLISKGQLFNFQPDTYIAGYELSFGDCFWERTPASANNCKVVLYNNAAANQHLPVDETTIKELTPFVEILLPEYQKPDYPNKLDAMAAFLKVIMIKIANIKALLNNGYDDFENKLYRRFTELVSEYFRNTHEVADFAKQLSVSSRKLSDICKKSGGSGAKDIINGQLIAEAKRSLQFSSKPVKEIAIDLNFSTPEQFSHFFKKNTTVAPKAYRSYFVNIGM